MKKQYLLCAVPYNLSDLPLGSFVPDPRYPNQDALSVITAEKDVDYSVQHDFDGILETTSMFSFYAQITRLMNFSRSKSISSTLHSTAQTGKIYELKAPKTFFELACAEHKARTWLQEGLEQGVDSFFIVGLRTFRDASVVQSGRRRESRKGDGMLRAGDLLKANTGVSTVDALDIKPGAEKKDGKRSWESSHTKGEKVYAVCYRKVKLSLRSVSDATLGKDNIWKLYSDQWEGDPNAPIHELCEAELEDFGFAIDGPHFPQIERFLDVDGIEFFVHKDVGDAE